MSCSVDYIDGLTVKAPAGSSTTMTIAAGRAADSANAVMMALSAGVNRSDDCMGCWIWRGFGHGHFIANSANATSIWIRRPDTGVVDVVFSTND